MFVHLRSNKHHTDFTAVGKISRSSFVDIYKRTTFGRMDEQTWMETEFPELRFYMNETFW